MGKVKNELKKRYDALIVGSGPAGASAAKVLTQSGLKTVIIEKCTLPRDKMCCGILMPSARTFVSENFGDIPDNALCEPREVKGGRFFLTNDSQCMETPILMMDVGENLPEYGLNTHRSEFDYWLCKESGASLSHNCLFVDYKMDGKDIIVKVKHGGNYVEVKTKYLIGADGPQSKVRRSVSPTFNKSIKWFPCYEEHYEGKINLEPGWLYIFGDREVASGMATLFHKGRSIEVTTSSKQNESCKKYFKRYVDVLKEKYGLRIDRTTMKRGIILNDMAGKDNYNLGEGVILLTGEAAGFLRTPDGITSALITGKAAGEAILRSFQSKSTPLECYIKHELIVSEIQICQNGHRAVAATGIPILSRD